MLPLDPLPDDLGESLRLPTDCRVANEELRESLLTQSVGIIRTRRRIKRLCFAAALVGCYLGGFVTTPLWRSAISATPPRSGSGMQLADDNVKEPFAISPAEIELGDCDSPSEHVASFTVTNLSDRLIRIVGSDPDCNCLTLDELPVAVSPGHEQSISIRAYVSGRENYLQKVILYIEDNGLRTSVVQIHARVRQSPQADKNSAAAIHSLNSLLGG